MLFRSSAAGLAVASGGLLRDAVSALARSGALGTAMDQPSVGYSFVWHCEIGLLFATLVALCPLAKVVRERSYEFNALTRNASGGLT